MAYPIKNTGTVQTNSIETGNFALGVNQGGYGLTSSTAFWNGKQPNVGGYVVYSGNGVNSPRMYTVANDAELITLSNQLGGSGITTIYGALNYFNLSSTLTCVNVEPLNIVTNGLRLYLDGGFTPSYPESGTTWTDLSGSGNTGTLINGPVYDSANGGSISFDGTNDYMSVASLQNTSFPQSKGTISLWYYIDSSPGSSTSIFDRNAVDGRNHYSIAYESNQGVIFSAYYGTGSSPFNFGFGGTQNAWNFIAFSYNNQFPYNLGFYVNNTGIETTNSNISNFTPTGQFAGFGSPTTSARKGKSFNLMIYNRNLSQTEVLQNYYAGCQRLIPTDNLVLWLDGQNTNTRVITPTTAYDASGNNNNGSFQNGTVLSYGAQVATFSFDGIDDRILTSVNTLASSTTWTIWVNRTQSMNFYNMMMGMYLPYFAFNENGFIIFSNNIGGTQQTLNSSQNLANNVWYHMVFVSSFSAGNTTMKIYLNGELQLQQTFAGQQPTTTNNSLRLGGWETGGTYPFNGKIGDVRLYNRELTSTEINYIYLAGGSRYGNRVFQSFLVLACELGTINVYSTSNISNYNFTVGMYLYTNVGLSTPLVTSSLGADYVVSPNVGECPLSDSGIETNSSGLILTITGNSYLCPQCGC
jgi:hypothetical protein